MNYDQMIAVLQAAKEGKAIQRLLKVPGSKWEDDPKLPWDCGLDFARYFYRVKPEPRVFYAVLRKHGSKCVAYRDRELAEKLAEKLAYPPNHKVVKLVEVLDDSMEASM